MKNERFQSLVVRLLAMGLGAFSITPAGAQPATVAERNEGSSFDVAPYLWAATAEVETSLPSPTALGVRQDRFETSFTAAAMLPGQARYRSVGLLVDFVWLRLDTDALTPGPAFDSVNLKSDLFFTTMALTWSLPLQGAFQAEVLAGARVWYMSEHFEAESGTQPGFKSAGNKTWVDPVIGTNLRFDLSRRWFVPVKGTIGGFGDSTDLAWEAFGGIGFRFTDWCSATDGYRYFHEDYQRSDFALNMDAQGFLLGVAFHF